MTGKLNRLLVLLNQLSTLGLLSLPGGCGPDAYEPLISLGGQARTPLSSSPPGLCICDSSHGEARHRKVERLMPIALVFTTRDGIARRDMCQADAHEPLIDSKKETHMLLGLDQVSTTTHWMDAIACHLRKVDSRQY